MTGRVVIVTGTSTGVGKTVATAALAARALAEGGRVTVVKPVQTGAADGDSDAREIHRLTGLEVDEYTTLDEPLAPDTAARRAGVTVPLVSEYASRIRDLARSHELVLVEGAGGVLVRLDTEGGTLIDLADALCTDPDQPTLDMDFVVVTASGLGTLNHTELTIAALRSRGFEPSGLVIGAWPSTPGLADRCNRQDLPRVTGVPLIGLLPAGAGRLTSARFMASAGDWFDRAPTASR